MGAFSDLRIYVAVTSPYPWNRGVTSTSPPSHRRISNPLTCPHREPPPRIWGNTTGSSQLLSLTNTTSHRGNTNTTSHKRGRHLAKQAQSTSSLRGIQIQHQLHLSLEGANHNLNLSLEGANHNPNQPLPKRDTTNNEGLQSGGFHNHKQILPQIKDPK